MKRRRPRPKIIVRPLPGNTAGLACKVDNTIEIDPDIKKEKDVLETYAHEALHLADWRLTERKVKYRANYIAEVLWKAGYRKKS
jgi:hypothetical protein